MMFQKDRSLGMFADAVASETSTKSSCRFLADSSDHHLVAQRSVFRPRSICTGLLLRGFLVLTLLLILNGPAVQAEDWMFKRSYFSHLPPEGTPQEAWLPRSRSAYRTAYYQELPSLSFRSELRINNRVLQVGPSTDRSIQAEGFIQIQP